MQTANQIIDTANAHSVVGLPLWQFATDEFITDEEHADAALHEASEDGFGLDADEFIAMLHVRSVVLHIKANRLYGMPIDDVLLTMTHVNRMEVIS